MCVDDKRQIRCVTSDEVTQVPALGFPNPPVSSLPLLPLALVRLDVDCDVDLPISVVHVMLNVSESQKITACSVLNCFPPHVVVLMVHSMARFDHLFTPYASSVLVLSSISMFSGDGVAKLMTLHHQTTYLFYISRGSLNPYFHHPSA